jgi:hypothetical protein
MSRSQPLHLLAAQLGCRDSQWPDLHVEVNHIEYF